MYNRLYELLHLTRDADVPRCVPRIGSRTSVCEELRLVSPIKESIADMHPALSFEMPLFTLPPCSIWYIANEVALSARELSLILAIIESYMSNRWRSKCSMSLFTTGSTLLGSLISNPLLRYPCHMCTGSLLDSNSCTQLENSLRNPSVCVANTMGCGR